MHRGLVQALLVVNPDNGLAVDIRDADAPIELLEAVELVSVQFGATHRE